MANNRLYLHSMKDNTYIALGKHGGMGFELDEVIEHLTRPKARKWIDEHRDYGMGSGEETLRYEIALEDCFELPEDAIYVHTKE